MADTISDSELIEALMAYFAVQGKRPSRAQLMRTLFDLLDEAEATENN